MMSDDVSSELKAIINEGNNSIKQYIDKLQAYYLNVKESQKSVPSPDCCWLSTRSMSLYDYCIKDL